MVTPLLFPLTYPRQDSTMLLARIGFKAVSALLPQAAGGSTGSGMAPPIGLDTIAPDIGPDLIEKAGKLAKDLENWASALGLGQTLSAGQLLDIMRRYQDESVQEIVDVLKNRSQEDHLLNALLLLSLSHRSDMEQDILEQEIRELEREQKKLRHILQGPGVETQENMLLHPLKPLGAIRERLKAWAVAFSLTHTDLSNVIPLGETLEIKDLVDTEAERRIGDGVAQDLATLPIPKDMPARAVEFQPLAGRLMNVLAACMTSEPEDNWRAEIESLEAEWSARLSDPSPVIKLVLSLYSEPLSSIISLFLPDGWERKPLPPLPRVAIYLV